MVKTPDQFRVDRAETTPNLASTAKVLWHREKVDAYLRGETIYPVTVDFHLTNHCSRQCPGCPSWLRSHQSQFSFPEITRFLSWISGKTKGLYLTGGGDPLLHPHYPEVMSEAREAFGFENIAIVTNGNRLSNSDVQVATLRHATAIRISLNCTNPEDYARIFGVSGKLWETVLRDTENLVRMKQEMGSSTEIGIATLTKEDTPKEELERFVEIGERLGVDWVHFRPHVDGWGTHDLKIRSSELVHSALLGLEKQDRGVKLVISHDRYRGQTEELQFEKLHAPAFLMTVTGEGNTYPGDEAFDLPEWNMGNILEVGSLDEYLDTDQRRTVQHTNSAQYPFKGGLTRAQIISSQIQSVIDGRGDLTCPKGIKHPHIL